MNFQKMSISLLSWEYLKWKIYWQRSVLNTPEFGYIKPMTMILKFVTLNIQKFLLKKLKNGAKLIFFDPAFFWHF